MTEAIWIALIAALPGLGLTLGTIFQVRRVHILVNSQKDALTRLLREALLEVDTLKQSALTREELLRTLQTARASIR